MIKICDLIYYTIDFKTNSNNTRSLKLKALSVVHSTCLKISLKMALQIGPKRRWNYNLT